MPSTFHIVTKSAFDQYGNAGVRARLSEKGYAAMMDPKKGKPHLVQSEAEELADGSVRFDDGEPIPAKVARDDKSGLFARDGNLKDGWREIAVKAARTDAAPVKNRLGMGPAATR
jgi:hypothetical protein